ncbi:MAG TPA: hypothetical protein PKY51_11530 [Fimbriimonadaceae bacterium]|nr:hypothetical protein [Fimbriimonadaceae bacterium]
MTNIMVTGSPKGHHDDMQTQRQGLTLLSVRPAGVIRGEQAQASVRIYKPFFLCGIVTVLTVGCLLGALALLGIARQASYTSAAWTPFVLAHANSQLFGWVGFFVMGFSLQQHGTSVEKKDVFLRISYGALGAMGLGITLRFLAEPLAQYQPGKWVWLGVLSGVFQIISVVLFSYNIGVNRFKKNEPLTWPTAFVFGSLGCLSLVSVAEPWVFAMTHQVNRDASIAFVAQWVTPLRETQFLGFVTLMIFGVSASKFPGCLGFRAAEKSLGVTSLVLWLSGLAARVWGWQHFYQSGLAPGNDLIFRFGGFLLFLGALSMSASLGVFEKARNHNPSQKFLRAAFCWLLVAGLLLVLEPLHLRTIGQPFSHAYTGGIRHAVTVGFISQMIIGVGYHLVSRMSVVPSQGLPQLWTVFVLMNLGNAARVSLEIMTDYRKDAFLPMGWTGFVELTGLAIWAFYMVRIMNKRGNLHAQTC